MNERQGVAWLHRRAGFGLGPTELAAAVARGQAAELRRLLDPAPGSPRGPDAWDDALLPLDPQDRDSRQYAIQAWIEGLVGTTVPLVDRMAWLWHGHLVSALDKVQVGRLMVDQIRLFRSHGLGSFPALLRAVTIDPAMLVYLDLRTSTSVAPNENYSRELLELFALGAEHVTEVDVQVGARALTGWVYQQGEVRFLPRRHDDSRLRFLGVDGVHDLDTVIAAVTGRPESAAFIAGTLARELLGTAPDALVQSLAATFRSSGLDLAVLVRAVLEAGLDGATEPVVLGPVPWFVQARRVTGATVDFRRSAPLLRAAGQLPMLPPNVAGWPGGAAWFAAGSVVARANLANLVASATPSGSPVLQAAQGSDPDLLADVLGLDGFEPATVAVLRGARPGAPRLALALVSPDFVIA